MIDLNKKLIYNFFSEKEEISFKKYQVLLDGENEKSANYFYYITQGYARIFVPGVDGEIISLAILGPGEIVPTILNSRMMQDSKIYLMSTDCLTPLRAYKSSKESLLEYFSKDAGLLHTVLRGSLCSVEYFVKRLPGLIYGKKEAKLAEFLLYLSGCFSYQESGVIYINVPMIHKDICTFIGSSREVVTLCLNDWKRKKIIDIKDSKIMIKKIDRLEKFASK